MRSYLKVVSIEKEFIGRETTLEKYLALVKRMENHFKSFIVEYIERNKNTEADELANAAAQSTPLPTDVFFQTIKDAPVKIVEPKPGLINATEG
jgi:hypothetical protein